jgi:hypothetical protein
LIQSNWWNWVLKIFEKLLSQKLQWNRYSFIIVVIK